MYNGHKLSKKLVCNHSTLFSHKIISPFCPLRLNGLPAKEMDNDLDNTLSCPICYEHYGIPKALPCLHTFCSRCLQQIADGYMTITCPICSTVHQLPTNGVDGFSTNYALADVMVDLKSPKFKEVMNRKNKVEEVQDIVKREGKNLKHLVEVVHTPLLQSITSLKRGAVQQQKDKVKLVNELYDSIIAHAEKERERHISGVEKSSSVAMKYFDDAQSVILKEKMKIESFYTTASRKSYTDMEEMDLKDFLRDAAEHNRGGRRIATEHSHLMWSDVDISEDKDQMRQIHSSLGDIVRVHGNKRSHRPRIGTMENGKNGRPSRRSNRSKSEPHPDAIEAACMPKVDRKKLSDPVRNVVDSVLQMLRGDNHRVYGEKKSDSNSTRNATPKRPLVIATTPAKRSLFDPPPYLRRSKSDEEPLVVPRSQATESAPRRSNSTQSTASGNSHSSGTPSIQGQQGPQKPPRAAIDSTLHSPCGIAITADDELMIAERLTGIIRLTHPRCLRTQRNVKPFRGHIDEAKTHALFDLTVLPNGDVAVTDSSLKKIIFLQKFNNYGAPQQIWMPHDMVPRGITSDKACMYVCDAGNGCIQVYTHTGKHCSSIELDNLTTDRSPAISEVCPQSITVSPNGNILVSDIINRCLYLVLRTGEISRLPMKFTTRNGLRCSTSPNEAVPRGVCWLDDHHALIVEDISQEVLLVNVLSMELLRVIRRLEFISLQGMVLDSSGQVLITDIENNRIHVITKSDVSSRGGHHAQPTRRSRSLTREDTFHAQGTLV